MRVRKIAAAMAIVAGCTAVVLSAGPGFAAEVSREDKAMKLPTTAEDHLAMARSYEDKVAEWRKEAAYHWEMAAAYKKTHPDFKGGVRNPDAATMEKHCAKIANDAEKLAADAEDTAKYHRLRAKELKGE